MNASQSLAVWRRSGWIFAQGDPATSVMYVEKGAVRLSVLSHAGKEAAVVLLEVGHFFGEGCPAGQLQRMATATAMAQSTILAVEKLKMVRQLHAAPAFADRFLNSYADAQHPDRGRSTAISRSTTLS